MLVETPSPSRRQNTRLPVAVDRRSWARSGRAGACRTTRERIAPTPPRELELLCRSRRACEPLRRTVEAAGDVLRAQDPVLHCLLRNFSGSKMGSGTGLVVDRQRLGDHLLARVEAALVVAAERALEHGVQALVAVRARARRLVEPLVRTCGRGRCSRSAPRDRHRVSSPALDRVADERRPLEPAGHDHRDRHRFLDSPRVVEARRLDAARAAGSRATRNTR